MVEVVQEEITTLSRTFEGMLVFYILLKNGNHKKRGIKSIPESELKFLCCSEELSKRVGAGGTQILTTEEQTCKNGRRQKP